MKTIGLIGGMSWESTVSYYQHFNHLVQANLGGLHSAKCIIYSVDFAPIEKMQQQGQWQQAGDLLAHAALSLQSAGADCVLIGTNTMHKVADIVAGVLSIPLLHIADSTASALLRAKIDTVALLGTKYTMEQDFYRSRLQSHGIQVLTPTLEERNEINRIIFEELCLGSISDSSRRTLAAYIDALAAQGAQGVVLGCTELPLLLQGKDTDLPLFDTTLLHAQDAVSFALG